jgi:hypothetical protein
LCTLLRNAALATPFVSIPSPLFSIQRGVYPSQFGVAASTTLPPRVQRSCARGLLSPFFPFNRSLSSGDRPSLHASREHAN